MEENLNWKTDVLQWRLDILKGQIHSFNRIGINNKTSEYLPNIQLLYLELKKCTDIIETLSNFEEIQKLYKSEDKY